MASKIPVLKMIVSFDPLEKQVRHALASWAETVGVQIKELSESALLLFLGPFITPCSSCS